MTMTPELFTAACAGVTLLIYFTSIVIGAVVAIFRKIDQTKEFILEDVNEKHHQNDLRWQATNALVIRHETILAPEFQNGTGRHHAR